MAQLTAANQSSASTSPAATGTVTPNLNNATIQYITLPAGNITVANPAPAGVEGNFLTLQFTQDSVGGRTVTWGTTYKTLWQPSPAANAISSITLRNDGTNWQQFNVTDDNLGNKSLPGPLLSTLTGLPTTATPGSGVVSVTPLAGSNDVRGRLTIASSSQLAVNTSVAVVSFASSTRYGGTMAEPVVMVVNSSQGPNSTTAFAGGFGVVAVSNTGFTLVTTAASVSTAAASTLTCDYWVVD